MFNKLKPIAKKLYDRILAVAFDNSDYLKKLWTGSLKHREGDIAFVPVEQLSQSKIALLTTGGFHLKEEQPFDMSDDKGDPSYREIEVSLPPERFMITHDYYDHKDAEQDRNVVFPIERLKELAAEGFVGGLHSHAYSFMGHVADDTHLPKLEENARTIGRKLKAAGVRVALLTPA
jgi:D-proline reductase (dithiol) PrdB